MKPLKLIFTTLLICVINSSFGQVSHVYVLQSTAAFIAEKEDLDNNPVWEDLPVMKGVIVYFDQDHGKLNIQNKKTNRILLQYNIAYIYPEILDRGLTIDEYACIDQDYNKCDLKMLYFKGTDGKNWIQLFIKKEKLYRLDLTFAID